MEQWFTEQFQNSARFSFRFEEKLYHEESQYQKLDVYRTKFFGNVMLLDGLLMLTEKDEFIYHEMIAHVPMSVAPHAKNILIIGGGDGGTARELLRYETVEKIDLVDIDEMVSKASKKFFPRLASAFADKRLHTYYKDGIEFVRKTKEKYDLIIIDSTDPVGPGEGLFTSDFYSNCHSLLNKKGILVNQSETAQWAPELVKSIYNKITAIFPIVRLYQAFIPTYPSGHWLFSFASKKIDPVQDYNSSKWESLNIETKYYNSDVHKGAFAIPTFIKELQK